MKIINNIYLYKLFKHCIKVCLLGTNGNYFKFFNFLLISILTSIFESLPIIFIIPFIGIITNPEKALENPYIYNLSNYLKITDPNELMLPLTVIFIFIVCSSSAIRLINITFLTKFNALIGLNISKTFYRKIIFAPYEFYIVNSSSDLFSSFTSKIGSCVFSIQAFLSFINSFLVSIFIILTVFLINTKISILLILLMSSAYILIAFIKNKKLKRISRILSVAEKKRMKVIQETIGSIRQLILKGNQESYIRKFRLYNDKREYVLADTYLTAIFPKYLVEAVGLSVIGIVAYMLRSFENIDPLPILGALTLGLQKLLPQVQTVYTSFTNITTYLDMSQELVSKMESIEEKNKFPLLNSKTKIKLKTLELKNIAYKYPTAKEYALKDINLIINKGDKIGIVGKTGAGKSTIVELITTLLEPSLGTLLFNGIDITKIKNRNHLMYWRQNIAYVPQFITLNDSSILENIAFGIPADEISLERAIKCAKMAKIYDYISSNREGIYTNIGERGIKLSGGQIQRVGIARALYTNSDVLILDEATSALDIKTEEQVVNSITKNNKDVTIIAISHRLSTLKNYERIIKVDNNRIFETNNLLYE